MRWLYLSPFGFLISFALNFLGAVFRPFMVYGYWNVPTKSFRKLVRISSTALLGDKKNIDIGEHCWIWHHSIIDGSNGVRIGEGVQIGAWVGIFTHGSQVSIRLHGRNYINVPAEKRIGYRREGVSIGDYTFIGGGSVVLPGVSIGKGCLVAPGSIVGRDVPDYSVVAGNPARIMGNTFEMDRDFLSDPLVRAQYFDQDKVATYMAEQAQSDSADKQS